ncbi:MAG: oligosaccharide flippase family protein [Lachnoclostridium sp.]|nr:oligosaccharide flippase family protein [Lachnospira sp.]MCM1249046.1 oligosaccharide flippase family protein [Lachnoclostridium sp.]MCM1535872.1 oligosaccharide flippase family protein [Clostridium sp.]
MDRIIKKSSFWSLLGTFLIKSVNLISIPIFSRLLSTEEYGQANIFFTYVSIFTVLTGLDFYGTVSKGQMLFKDDKYGFLSVGFFVTSVFSGAMLVLFHVFQGLFGSLLSMNPTELHLLVIYSYAMAVVSFMSGSMIYDFNYKGNTALSFSVAVLNLVFSVILIQTFCAGDRKFGRILGAALPAIVIGVVLYIYVMRRGRKIWKTEYAKYYVCQGIPLIPHNLSHFILGNADKIMIARMIGEAQSGIYSLVYSLGLMIGALIEAANNVWGPWMFRKLEAGQDAVLKKAYTVYAMVFSVIAVLAGAVTPEIIKIISPVEYWEGVRFSVWIVFSAYLIFIYQLYVNLEFYEMKTYLISMGTVLAAGINIVLNAIFLRKFGYGFAAVSTVASYVVLTVFHMLTVNCIIKKRVIHNTKIIIMVLLVSAVFFVMHLLLDNYIIRYVIAMTAAAAGAAVVKKSYIAFVNENEK